MNKDIKTTGSDFKVMRFIPRPDCQIKNLAEIYEAHLPDLGRFVEVGAFDGATYSNTVFLAEMGWKGLYIEARPDFAQQCITNHRHHPLIDTVACAVSDHKGFAELYDIGECSTLVWDQTAKNWGGDINRKFTVHVDLLETILEANNIEPDFDLLVVDVEHHELEVLRPFDLNKWRPKMCIVETHEMGGLPVNFLAKPIGEYFDSFGYKKIHADTINTIWIR